MIGVCELLNFSGGYAAPRVGYETGRINGRKDGWSHVSGWVIDH